MTNTSLQLYDLQINREYVILCLMTLPRRVCTSGVANTSDSLRGLLHQLGLLKHPLAPLFFKGVSVWLQSSMSISTNSYDRLGDLVCANLKQGYVAEEFSLVAPVNTSRHECVFYTQIKLSQKRLDEIISNCVFLM